MSKLKHLLTFIFAVLLLLTGCDLVYDPMSTPKGEYARKFGPSKLLGRSELDQSFKAMSLANDPVAGSISDGGPSLAETVDWIQRADNVVITRNQFAYVNDRSYTASSMGAALGYMVEVTRHYKARDIHIKQCPLAFDPLSISSITPEMLGTLQVYRFTVGLRMGYLCTDEKESLQWLNGESRPPTVVNRETSTSTRWWSVISTSMTEADRKRNAYVNLVKLLQRLP